LVGFLLLCPLAACAIAQPSDEHENAGAQQLLDELRGVYRTLFALSGDDERSRILENLIAHEMPAMRAFGLDLTRRTLLNARTVQAGLLDRAVDLIEDDSPDVRRNAAQLIATVGGERASSTLARALEREHDSAVATEIMRALSQNPGGVYVGLLRRWMAADAEPSDAAFGVALVIARKSPARLSDQDRESIRQIIGDFDPSQATPARVSLAWVLGLAEYTKAALHSDSPELRISAATAISSDPQQLDALTEIAQTDPAIFTIAADAIASHRATAAGYRLVLGLPSGSEDIKRSGVRRVLLSLNPNDLVAVVRSESDLFIRETMLRHLEEDGTAARLGDGSDWPYAVRELITTRWKINDCEGVVRASALLDGLLGGAPDAQTASERIICTIMLGQIDTASQITTDLLTQGEESVGKLADAWIAGISSLDADTTRRAEAIAAARELFGESLTPAQMRALDESGGPNPVENDSPGGDTIPPQ